MYLFLKINIVPTVGIVFFAAMDIWYPNGLRATKNYKETSDFFPIQFILNEFGNERFCIAERHQKKVVAQSKDHFISLFTWTTMQSYLCIYGSPHSQLKFNKCTSTLQEPNINQR